MILAIIWLGICLVALTYWLLGHVSNIILLILLGSVLAVGFSSLTDWIQDKTSIKPRWLIIIMIYLVLMLAIVLIVLLVGIPLVLQIKQLIETYPSLVEDISGRLAGAQKILGRFGFGSFNVSQMTAKVSTLLENYGQAIFSGFLNFVLVFSSGVGQFILIVVISFYLLLEESNIIKSITDATSEKYQNDLKALGQEIKTIINSFIGGQFFLALIMGVIAAIFAISLSLPYSALIGVFVAMTGLIPIVGSYLGAIPPLLIAYSVSPSKALIFLILFAVFSQFVSYYLQPKIVGKAIGLNPLTILIALLVGFQIAGFWGAIFAAPVLSIFFVILKYIAAWYRNYAESL